MMIPEQAQRFGVAALIVFDQGYVLAKRLSAARDYLNTHCAPGGALEPGENIFSGLMRELEEEMGKKFCANVLRTAGTDITWRASASYKRPNGERYKMDGWIIVINPDQFDLIESGLEPDKLGPWRLYHSDRDISIKLPVTPFTRLLMNLYEEDQWS